MRLLFAAILAFVMPQVLLGQTKEDGKFPIRRAANTAERVANLLQSRKALHKVDSIQGDGTTIWVNLISQNSYPQTYTMGVYSLPASKDFTLTALATNYYLKGTGGATFFDNVFHYIDYMSYYGMTSYYYGEYSTEDWTETVPYSSNSSAGNIANTGSTYDPASGNVYAFSGNTSFETIDYGGFSSHVIKQFSDTSFISIAANAQGEIYAISKGGGLHKIDKSTGADTYIGYTGVQLSNWTNNNQGSAFDMKTGKLYWAAYPNGKSNSVLYVIDVATGKASYIGDFPNSCQIGSIYVPAPAAEDGAPAKASDLIVNFEGAEKTGTVTFTLPTKTFDGNDLTGDLVYYLVVNSDTLATDTAAAGTQVTKSVTVPSSGSTKFNVTTHNSVGKSPNASVTKWIGYDEPYPLSYFSQSMDSTGKVTLSWSPVTSVKHNGYIDKITYRIVRMPREETVADGIDSTRFVDQLPDSIPMTSYWYRIYAVNGDMTSTVCEQSYNKVTYGGAFDIPWYCSFEGEDSMKLFTTVKKDGDYNDWYRSSSSYWDSDKNEWENYYFAYIYGSSSAPLDNWLITPPLKMKGGREYNFGYSYKSGTWQKDNLMLIAFGQGTNPSNYETVSDTLKFSGTGMPWYHNTTTVRVSEDGEYRFAFHAISPADAGGISIDSLHVWAGALFGAPDSVTSLKMNPTLGEYKVDLSFVAPTKNGGGDPLASIDYILVKSGDQLIDSISNPSPGQAIAFTDTTAFSGTRTYSVRAYNSYGEGAENKVTGIVGDDVPDPPARSFSYGLGDDLDVVDNLDGTLTLKWFQPSTTGANGRPVNLDHVTYSIWPIYGGAGVGGPTIKGIKDTTYILTDFPQTGAQQDVTLDVYANTLAGQSMASYYDNRLYSGAPYELPIHEGGHDERDDSAPYKWAGNAIWYTTAYSADTEEPGSYAMVVSKDNMSGYLESRKIDIKGVKNPKVAFSVWGQKPSAGKEENKLQVIQWQNGSHKVQYVLEDIGFAKDSFPENGGWKRFIVPLIANEKGYVMIRFAGVVNDHNIPIAIDNIDIYDMASYDLTAKLTGPKALRVNHKGKFSVKVTNRGDHDASGYTVKLLDSNDSILASTIGAMLKPGEDSTYSFEFTVPARMSGAQNIRAFVDFSEDENQADNSDTLAVNVTESEYQPVDSLSGTRNGTSYKLSWKAPENTAPAITEDFEDYEPFTKNMGDWTLRDVDGATQTYQFSDVTFPGMGGAMSYIVFNTSMLGVDASQSSLAPPSGDQYAISFDAVASTAKDKQSDDWLISPELSGNEQTVTLKAGILSSQRPETFDVMYSATDTAMTSFQLLETKNLTTAGFTDYEFIVPEDAKYFALRHTTASGGFALAFDDISFEAAPEEVTGYNVYIDGKLVATLPAGTTEYTGIDDNVEHTYAVSALYGDKESELRYVDVANGINQVTVSVDDHTTIYTTGGIFVGSGKAAFDKLPAGVYITRSSNGKIVKVTKK